jgi:hypothetical protein
MTHRTVFHPDWHKWPLYFGWFVALAWAAFWIWFGAASAFFENEGVVAGLVHVAVPGLFFGVILFLCWRLPRFGGVILVMASLVILVGYRLMVPGWPLARYLGVVTLLGGPPLVAGVLLLVRQIGGRSRATVGE